MRKTLHETKKAYAKVQEIKEQIRANYQAYQDAVFATGRDAMNAADDQLNTLMDSLYFAEREYRDANRANPYPQTH